MSVEVNKESEQKKQIKISNFESAVKHISSLAGSGDGAVKAISMSLAEIPLIRRSFCKTDLERIPESYLTNNAYVKLFLKISSWMKVPEESTEEEETVTQVEEEETVTPSDTDKASTNADDKKATDTDVEAEKKENEPPKVIHLSAESWSAIWEAHDIGACTDGSVEVNLYLDCLLLLLLMDVYNRKFPDRLEVEPSKSEILPMFTDLHTSMVTHINTILRSSTKSHCDVLVSRAILWMSLCKEVTVGFLPDFTTLLNSFILTAGTAKFDNAKGMGINCFLRVLIACGDWKRASAVLAKSSLPDNVTRASVLSRYYLYKGLILSVSEENYSEALKSLNEAYRKCQRGPRSLWLRLEITRISVVVELLSGHIPRCATFTDKETSSFLREYFALANAVRLGNVEQFQSIIKTTKTLSKQAAWPLITRLPLSVIRTGLIRLAGTYKAISLEDVKDKLCLGSVDETIAVVSKAIKDGVLKDVELDSYGSVLYSRDRKALNVQKYSSIIQSKIDSLRPLQKEISEAIFIPTNDDKDDDEKVKEAEQKRQKQIEIANQEEDMFLEEFEY